MQNNMLAIRYYTKQWVMASIDIFCRKYNHAKKKSTPESLIYFTLYVNM